MFWAGVQVRGSYRFATLGYNCQLDALRALAMVLGIWQHSSVFLLPVAFWPVHDLSVCWDVACRDELTSNPYAYTLSLIHGFRAQLFFTLSGFFAALLWQRGGLRELGIHRLKRVGLPLAVCAVTITPVTALLWAMGKGEVFSYWQWPLQWLGGLHHLWFLWYLLLITLAFIILAGLFSRFSHPVFQFRHPVWWLLIPMTLLPQFLMQELVFGTDNPETGGLIPTPRLFGYLLLFYLFGVFFYRQGIVIRRWWTLLLLPAVLLCFPAGLALLYPALFLGSEPAWAWAATTLFQTAFAWLSCFGLFGLFNWIASGDSVWRRYVSDSSYWLYIGHLPLVIAGQMLLANWPVNRHLKFALICIAVTVLLTAVYQLGVRHTIIGAMLNGPRRQRRPPERQADVGSARS